jgi:DNA-binding CsgD family transcriptional regulator
MHTTNHNTGSIERKLNVIISLLLRIANSGSELTLKEQVRDLASFGLSSSEIAEIVGKKVGYVSKELSILKKEST